MNLWKPPEYWLVLLGMVIYVAMKDAESAPLQRRLVKTVASGLLAVGFSKEIAPWLNGSEAIATVLIMAAGTIILDIGVALISDREFIKDLIRKRLGGRNDE
jgi:hypothetical protein